MKAVIPKPILHSALKRGIFAIAAAPEHSGRCRPLRKRRRWLRHAAALPVQDAKQHLRSPDTAAGARFCERIAMAAQLVDRAVVLGGGLAGLLAANVLAKVYPEVLVVDRDELAGATGYRRGVPHGRHAHGLVARGPPILEE